MSVDESRPNEVSDEAQPLQRNRRRVEAGKDPDRARRGLVERQQATEGPRRPTDRDESANSGATRGFHSATASICARSTPV